MKALDERKEVEQHLLENLQKTSVERQQLSDKLAGIQRTFQTMETERNDLAKQTERLERDRAVMKRALQRVESLRDAAEKENSKSTMEKYAENTYTCIIHVHAWYCRMLFADCNLCTQIIYM